MEELQIISFLLAVKIVFLGMKKLFKTSSRHMELSPCNSITCNIGLAYYTACKKFSVQTLLLWMENVVPKENLMVLATSTVIDWTWSYSFWNYWNTLQWFHWFYIWDDNGKTVIIAVFGKTDSWQQIYK